MYSKRVDMYQYHVIDTSLSFIDARARLFNTKAATAKELPKVHAS
jgi:hypothetical protein